MSFQTTKYKIGQEHWYNVGAPHQFNIGVTQWYTMLPEHCYCIITQLWGARLLQLHTTLHKHCLNVGEQCCHNVQTMLPESCLNLGSNFRDQRCHNVHTTLSQCCSLVRFQCWAPKLAQRWYNVATTYTQCWYNNHTTLWQCSHTMMLECYKVSTN